MRRWQDLGCWPTCRATRCRAASRGACRSRRLVVPLRTAFDRSNRWSGVEHVDAISAIDLAQVDDVLADRACARGTPAVAHVEASSGNARRDKPKPTKPKPWDGWKQWPTWQKVAFVAVAAALSLSVLAVLYVIVCSRSSASEHRIADRCWLRRASGSRAGVRGFGAHTSPRLPIRYLLRVAAQIVVCTNVCTKVCTVGLYRPS